MPITDNTSETGNAKKKNELSVLMETALEAYFNGLAPAEGEVKEALAENKALLDTLVQNVRESILKIQNEKSEHAYQDAQEAGFPY